LEVEAQTTGAGIYTVKSGTSATSYSATLPDATGTLLMTDGDGSSLSGLSHTPEGTAVVSTGETGATKFLREDGDGTCSWQAAGGGKLKKVVTVQSRTIATYAVPTSGDGVELSPVTLTITPTAAGNTVKLTWIIQGDCNSDSVFLVTRNGTKLTDTTDASNNRYAGIISFPYDPDAGSTPNSVSVTIMDNNCLNTSSVYRLLIRTSSGTARTFYFNRTQDSAGGDSQENGLCSGVAMEMEV